MKETEMIYCDDCGKKLLPDEIGLNKKLCGLDTEEFLCLSCFAQCYQTTEEELLLKIEDFKESGCTLFGDEI